MPNYMIALICKRYPFKPIEQKSTEQKDDFLYHTMFSDQIDTFYFDDNEH